MDKSGIMVAGWDVGAGEGEGESHKSLWLVLEGWTRANMVRNWQNKCYTRHKMVKTVSAGFIVSKVIFSMSTQSRSVSHICQRQPCLSSALFIIRIVDFCISCLFALLITDLLQLAQFSLLASLANDSDPIDSNSLSWSLAIDNEHY